MTALDEVFAHLKTEGRPALIGYWVAGFPTLEYSIRAVQTMIDAGVDIVEVGIAYSDPVMDGPTIQRAAQQALESGVRVANAFDVVESVHAHGAPAVVMTYWNVIERYGVDTFAQDLQAAHGSGIITPDLTPDESQPWDAAARAHNLNQIFLVAPSSTDERLALTANAASGFIYASAVMGVTGQRASLGEAGEELVHRLREVTDQPVGVGLGVSTADQAAEVARYADAVIVGSAFIQTMLDHEDYEAGLRALAQTVRDIRSGIERSHS